MGAFAVTCIGARAVEDRGIGKAPLSCGAVLGAGCTRGGKAGEATMGD
jgi:hypothetical protein